MTAFFKLKMCNCLVGGRGQKFLILLSKKATKSDHTVSKLSEQCGHWFTVKHSKAGLQTSIHPQYLVSNLLGLQSPIIFDVFLVTEEILVSRHDSRQGSLAKPLNCRSRYHLTRTSLLWFCGSPWIFIQLDNFFKLPPPGIEPLTLGLYIQHSPPTPRGLPLNYWCNITLSPSHCESRVLLIFDRDMPGHGFVHIQRIQKVLCVREHSKIFFTQGGILLILQYLLCLHRTW